MGIEQWILRLVLGAGIGFCIGLTGIGGGVLVLPALTVILGLPSSIAVGTASLYAFLTKCYATFEHFRLKTIDIRTSLFLLLGAVPGNVVTAWVINRAVKHMGAEGESMVRFQQGLKMFIAFVVLFSAIVLIVDLVLKGHGAGSGTGNSVGARLNSRPTLKWTIAVITGTVIGSLIGATSVGGGVLMIPALIILFGLPSSRTVGTSIFVAVILTFMTSIVYGASDQMDWHTALLMALGSLAGVPLGSKLCARLPERGLRWLVIAVVFVSAIFMFVRRSVTGGH
jgi:uncharacterized membrane protein YfcA